MAIKNLTEVPRDQLVGKFICEPSVYGAPYGYPAVIEKTTAARLTFRRLPRGAWDNTQKEWQVSPSLVAPASDNGAGDPFGELFPKETSQQCNHSSVKLVCDTAHEAIGLYHAALQATKAIEKYKKDMLAKLDADAKAGWLPVPFYLVQAAQENPHTPGSE